MTDYTEDSIARYWDANSRDWADQLQRGRDVYRELLNYPSFFDLVGPVDGKAVLDLGCGEGHTSRRLASTGARVTGVDLSTKMVELAKAAEQREPLGISYHVGSFSKMRFLQEAAFDVAVAFMSLMDGPDYLSVLRETKRVLAPGGILCYSISHPCFLTEGVDWLKDPDGKDHRLAVGNYFSDKPHVERWGFGSNTAGVQSPEFTIAYFPRTLSEYINGLQQTGFQLVEIREPRPTEADCRKHPTMERWRTHAAIFLQVKAKLK